MHLYLSSFLFGNRASDLRRLVGTPKAVVVANALDNVAPQVRREYAQGQVTELTKLGFQTEELDLRKYFKHSSDLGDRLNEIGLLWVTGGNAFLLRQAMKQSALDEFIVGSKARPSFVYGGFSAGACVAAPTLRGVELMDVPEATADGYRTEVVWDGLGLVPYSIVPHFRSAHPESERAEQLAQYYREREMPFVTLSDGEVVVVAAT